MNASTFLYFWFSLPRVWDNFCQFALEPWNQWLAQSGSSCRYNSWNYYSDRKLTLIVKVIRFSCCCHFILKGTHFIMRFWCVVSQPWVDMSLFVWWGDAVLFPLLCIEATPQAPPTWTNQMRTPEACSMWLNFYCFGSLLVLFAAVLFSCRDAMNLGKGAVDPWLYFLFCTGTLCTFNGCDASATLWVKWTQLLQCQLKCWRWGEAGELLRPC